MISDSVNTENTYLAAFRALQSTGSNVAPSWLQRLRERSMDHFEVSGFPGVENEEWKYTNVAPIARADFSPIMAVDGPGPALVAEEIAPFSYPEAQDSRLVFLNGVRCPNLSSLAGVPEGVSAVGLDEALG